MSATKRLHVYTDGASRGNPGPAAVGIVIIDDEHHPVARLGRFIGTTTNNQAEYSALILALEMVAGYNPEHVDFFLDSELVVNQLRGSYRVRSADLLPLYQRCTKLIRQLPSVKAHHVPRTANREADGLANRALDQALSRKMDRS